MDMSITAVGGSYAAMVGIEAYMKTKGRVKGLKEGMRSLTIREKSEEEGKEKEKADVEKPGAGALEGKD